MSRATVQTGENVNHLLQNRRALAVTLGFGVIALLLTACSLQTATPAAENPPAIVIPAAEQSGHETYILQDGQVELTKPSAEQALMIADNYFGQAAKDKNLRISADQISQIIYPGGFYYTARVIGMDKNLTDEWLAAWPVGDNKAQATVLTGRNTEYYDPQTKKTYPAAAYVEKLSGGGEKMFHAILYREGTDIQRFNRALAEFMKGNPTEEQKRRFAADNIYGMVAGNPDGNELYIDRMDGGDLNRADFDLIAQLLNLGAKSASAETLPTSTATAPSDLSPTSTQTIPPTATSTETATPTAAATAVATSTTAPSETPVPTATRTKEPTATAETRWYNSNDIEVKREGVEKWLSRVRFEGFKDSEVAQLKKVFLEALPYVKTHGLDEMTKGFFPAGTPNDFKKTIPMNPLEMLSYIIVIVKTPESSPPLVSTIPDRFGMNMDLHFYNKTGRQLSEESRYYTAIDQLIKEATSMGYTKIGYSPDSKGGKSNLNWIKVKANLDRMDYIWTANLSVLALEDVLNARDSKGDYVIKNESTRTQIGDLIKSRKTQFKMP